MSAQRDLRAEWVERFGLRCAALLLVWACSGRALAEGPPSRCLVWRALPWVQSERAGGFDPIPVLLSDPSLAREARPSWRAVQVAQVEGGVELSVPQTVDLMDGDTQRIYLRGERGPCPSSAAQPKAALDASLRLESAHPVMAWADGSALPLRRVAPRAWLAQGLNEPRFIVIRVSPLVGQPRLKLSGLEGYAHLAAEASSISPPSSQLKLSAQPLEGPTPWAQWRVEVKPFGRRELAFSGSLRSNQEPPSLEAHGDAQLLRDHLSGACDQLEVSQAGWEAMAEREEWRYLLSWRCHMSGARVLLIGESWEEPLGALRWTLDKGPTREGLHWLEEGSLGEGGRRVAWNLSPSWASLSRQVRRSRRLAQLLTSGDKGDARRLDAPLKASALPELLKRKTSAPLGAEEPAVATVAPQPLIRRWSHQALPVELSAKLTPQVRPLWALLSYQLSPVVRLTHQSSQGDYQRPIERAQSALKGGWGEGCRARGEAAELIAWSPAHEPLSEGASARPLPYLGLRCGERAYSLKAERGGGLTSLPSGAWCLSLEATQPAPYLCDGSAAQAVTLEVKWSAHRGGWRARWRHQSGELEKLQPPPWWLGGQRSSGASRPLLAAPDLMWESLHHPLRRLQTESVYAWWRLPQPLDELSWSEAWRAAISPEARGVEGSPSVVELSPYVMPAQVQLLKGGRRALRRPLSALRYKRVIELPAEHPAAAQLQRLGASHLRRPFGYYHSARPEPLSAREGGGWRWTVELSLSEGVSALSEAEQLRFAQAIDLAERRSSEALKRATLEEIEPPLSELKGEPPL